MSTTKEFKFTISGKGYVSEDVIRAVNPSEARRFAEARYPGCNLYGFNMVSGSSR